jgi:hypothetical protein
MSHAEPTQAKSISTLEGGGMRLAHELVVNLAVVDGTELDKHLG